MRMHGEEYIRIYKPGTREIKFIKDVSKCKTPALGGLVVTCKKCKSKTYLYKSCGNAQCPKCQSIKRMQWQDKIASRTLKCPYQHIVFTLPHEMNYIANRYPELVYGNLFKAAWKTIKKLCGASENLGALPAMTAVLHTFGSDLKHHIHLHTLVSFGGINKDNKWQWPKRKNKLASYRKMCSMFKQNYLKEIRSELLKRDREYHISISSRLTSMEFVRWCVFNSQPTTHTKVIEEYLGRYICRIGVSNKKLRYDRIQNKVILNFNDYKHQEKGKAAPQITKTLDPLVAIGQILTHVLPANFRKVRYYGLASLKKLREVETNIPQMIKENGQTVRKIFQIIRVLNGISEEESEINEELTCPICGSNNLIVENLDPDKDWYDINIRKSWVHNKSPTIAGEISIIPSS